MGAVVKMFSLERCKQWPPLSHKAPAISQSMIALKPTLREAKSLFGFFIEHR